MVRVRGCVYVNLNPQAERIYMIQCVILINASIQCIIVINGLYFPLKMSNEFNNIMLYI